MFADRLGLSHWDHKLNESEDGRFPEPENEPACLLRRQADQLADLRRRWVAPLRCPILRLRHLPLYTYHYKKTKTNP